MALLDVLKQYLDPASAPHAGVEDHFDEVAQQTSRADLGNGVAEAFRSDRTPPFGDMLSGLFDRSNPQQKAGMLNELIRTLGPTVLAGLASGGLGRVLGGLGGSTGQAGATRQAGGAAPTVTVDQASQVSPEDVREIAAHAEQHDASVVDRLGRFYGEHPDLVKSLGAAALAVALGRMARKP